VGKRRGVFVQPDQLALPGLGLGEGCRVRGFGVQAAQAENGVEVASDKGVALGEVVAKGEARGEGGRQVARGEPCEKARVGGVARGAFARGADIPAEIGLPAGVAGEGAPVGGEGEAGAFVAVGAAVHAFEAAREQARVVVDFRVEPKRGGSGIDDGGRLDGEAVGLPGGNEEAARAGAPAAVPPGLEVGEAVAENGQGFVAERAVHRAAPVLDAVGAQRRGEIDLGKVVQLDARVPVERIVVPVVGDQVAREERDGLGNKREHVGPHAHAQPVGARELVEPADVACEVRGETDVGDLGTAARMAAQGKRFI
jgi:hypothetical protein